MLQITKKSCLVYKALKLGLRFGDLERATWALDVWQLQLNLLLKSYFLSLKLADVSL